MSEFEERIAREVAHHDIPQRGRNALIVMIVLFGYSTLWFAFDLLLNGSDDFRAALQRDAMMTGILVSFAWGFRILERMGSTRYTGFYNSLLPALIVHISSVSIAILHTQHENWPVTLFLSAIAFAGLGYACAKIYRLSILNGCSMGFLGLLVGGVLSFLFSIPVLHFYSR